MRRNNQSVLALLSLACIVLLAACNSSTPVLQYVTITPPTGTTSVSGTFQFTAQAYYTNGRVQDGTSLVTWASSNTSAATIVTGGLATGVGGGTTSITATAAGTAGASATLTVNDPVSLSVSPQTTATGTGQTVSFTANVTNGKSGVTWTASAGTVDVNGNFVAPAGPQSSTVTVTATSKDDTTKSASATVNVVAPGQVTTTSNVQVAQYTVAPAAAGNVFVQFGQDTNYGLTTWTQPVPSGGGPVSLFVAGMKANTPYHMRGVVAFSDGTQFMDADQTFTTGAIPAVELPTITATTTAGQTPQSGVELLDLIDTGSTAKKIVAVTDLAGNMLWGYNPPLAAGSGANGVKLLSNGHLLINFSGQNPDGLNSVIQEVDLGNNVIWQMTAAQLNQALAAATCAGCNITVVGTHHDFAILPNGHLIVIAAQNQVESGVTVTGDVLIDLDQNHNPVWAWSTFDHLDVTRQPFGTDWTHTNSVVYSPDDKNLIVSMRNQSWVIKIDYGNGQGTGEILWKLGKDGDFTLMNGTDPVDWFYAQHDANVVSANSSGTFQLMLFDNGDNRVLDSSGTICGTTTPCVSRVPILQLDESGHTATIEWVDALAPVFSFFGGNARSLANGNIEFDECAPTFPTGNAAIFEVTKTTPPQTVWQMQIAGQFAYRGIRIPSLYPGVQW